MRREKSRKLYNKSGHLKERMIKYKRGVQNEKNLQQRIQNKSVRISD